MTNSNAAAAQPAAAQEAVSPTDAVCHILARAPAEFTYWEKRVWRRGVMDSTAAQEPIGYANLHHLNEKSTDGVVLRKQNEFFTVPVYAAPVAAAPIDGWDAQAYSQMAGELEAWKLRAVTAEGDFNRLCNAMNAEDGPTHMGEPVLNTPAAPGIDLEQFREAVEHWKRDLHDDYKGGHIHDGGEAMRKAEHLLALIDASPKDGGDELKVWGTQRPNSMPKLFGARHIAELNWYPDEGYDLVCMQVIERVQATSHGAGVSDE